MSEENYFFQYALLFSSLHHLMVFWCFLCVDACVSMPCLNGGVCSQFGSGYQCQCQQGYSGVTCGIVQSEYIFVMYCEFYKVCLENWLPVTFIKCVQKTLGFIKMCPEN